MQPDPNRDPWEQRGIESVTGQFGVPDWTALSPFGVAALGPARQPVQKMMALQGALARGIDLITSIQWPPAISVAGLRRTWLVAAGTCARRGFRVSPSTTSHGPTPTAPG
jgi:hypothetical protein